MQSFPRSEIRLLNHIIFTSWGYKSKAQISVWPAMERPQAMIQRFLLTPWGVATHKEGSGWEFYGDP